jgi:intein/homing endonuclease
MKNDTPAILRRLLETQQTQLEKTIRTLGLKPTITLLNEARRRLRGDIQDAIRRGGSESFTVAQRRQILQHLELGVAELAKKFKGILDPASADIMAKSVDHLEAEIGVYVKASGRRPAPVSGLDTAAHFADRKTLLRDLRVIDPDTMKAVTRTNAKSTARYGADLLDAFEREMALGKITGASVDEMTDRLLGVGDSVFNGERYRAERIVRTELMNHYGTARQDAMEAVADDVPMRRLWVAVMEDRTCPACAAAHGQTRAIDEPFIVGGKHVPHPPAHPHCMLPGTRVTGDYIAGLKARYSGPAVRIKTMAGNAIAVTANHPVLTTRGMIPASSIRKGDHVFRHLGEIESVSSGARNDQHGPSAVEEVFESLARHGLARVDVTGLDLHGDAAATDGHVDIVGTDRESANGIESARIQRLHQIVLVLAAMRQILIDRFGVSDLLLERALASAHSSPRGRALTLYCLAVATGSAPLQHRRFGSAADANAEFLESAREHYPLDPGVVGQMLQGLTSVVSSDQPRKVGDVDPVVSGDNARLFEPLINKVIGASERPRNSAGIHTRGVELEHPVGVDGSVFIPSARHVVFVEHQVNEVHRALKLDRDVGHGHTGSVQVDDVVGVDSFYFTGHVYDLQSRVGLIVAENTVISNCMCVVAPIIASDAIPDFWKPKA